MRLRLEICAPGRTKSAFQHVGPVIRIGREPGSASKFVEAVYRSLTEKKSNVETAGNRP